jgi:hypothetical protein
MKPPAAEAGETYLEASRYFVFRKQGFHSDLAFMKKRPTARLLAQWVQPGANVNRSYASVKS